MGRNAAGESFLRGFLSYSKTDKFYVQVQKPDHVEAFINTAKSFNRTEPVKVITRNSLAPLAEAGVLYYPGPTIGNLAFQRALFGHGKWSLCGITHTTSSAGAMDALTELLTAPVQPWDAVICTSTAVKNNVERLLTSQQNYLKDRLGITKVILPQLPVIPLGIHTKDFVYSEAQKKSARDTLGVDADTVVVLFMGRLSFHAKAHPLAMYQALEKATLATGKKVLLVECGWHANDAIRNAYSDAVKMACPDVRAITLDGRTAENRQMAWAGADIFCSLSDNIQETFGITPIEAMATGLPVIVSDWDGYKDTVRDGVDGFRIPTVMPEKDGAGDLALRHALEIDTYDRYCGNTCSLIAVDIEAATAAFEKLFNSLELRLQMGEAGRRRAAEIYDWTVIIPQYEALWAELSDIRKSQSEDLKPLPQPWPARIDPFQAFAAYPTKQLNAQTMIALTDANFETAMTRTMQYAQLKMVNFANAIMPTDDEIRTILRTAATGPQQAQNLMQAFPFERQPFLLRSLAWFIKLDILKLYE